MLVSDLGYRSATEAEISNCLDGSDGKVSAAEANPEKAFDLPTAILSREPFISYSGIVPDSPLGLAGLLPSSFGERDAWFLLSPTWSIEAPEVAADLRRQAVLLRRNHRHRNLIFMCNTEQEASQLRALGEAAVFHNKTCSTSESVFRPLPEIPIEFDAIYNAQLAKWKRHQLARHIERCAFIFYRGTVGSSTEQQEQKTIARHALRAPGHVFLNRFDETNTPVRMTPEEVNHHLNRARVGLCLSRVEGAMFASTEYLLAGLPVVSTPSRGGRDVYFDKDFCLVVEADRKAVAEAVRRMIGRAIPRQEIREKTLERLNRDRLRFVELLNDICSESGTHRRVRPSQVFSDSVLMKWRYWKDAVRQALDRPADGSGH